MIKCKNISFDPILNNMTFDIPKGLITVIIGKNGSGKSTLMRCLAGLLNNNGQISINGKDIKTINKKELSRQIAFMPQNLQAPNLSLRQLVSFGRHPYTGISGRLSENDESIVDSVINTLDLCHISGRNLQNLSGGERRLAYFAMMLAQSTPILLCDEPTANLDAEHQKQIISLLAAQKSMGKTVVCILHDINQAIETADRFLLLDRGELIFNGNDLGDLPVSHFGLKEYICANKKLYL